jgi:hypothetical protein
VLATALLTVVPLLSCRYYQRYKQIETYRLLSLITGQFDRSISDMPAARRRTLARAIISRYAPGGRDAWGNPIVFYDRETDGRYDYVVVSVGSDGRRDVNEPDDYFRMGATNIHHSPASDIVFRNGLPITEAGK